MEQEGILAVTPPQSLIARCPAGLAAVAVATVALVLAAVGNRFLPQASSPPGGLLDRITGELYEEPTAVAPAPVWPAALVIASIGLAGCAVLLGLVAWFRHEPRRVFVSALVLAGLALVWKHLLLMLLVTLVIGAIFFVMSELS